MKVLITGASGLIGSALVAALAKDGHEVIRAVRKKPAGHGEVFWDPIAGDLDASNLSGIEQVVHLAGEGIAGGRWTEQRKSSIRDSRSRGTKLVSETLVGLPQAPRVFVSASAIGFYGDRGAEVLTEESPSGTGFLAEVTREWERATEPASQAGIRVVNLRIGVVLSANGGALAKVLTPFRLGLGGKIGSGEQYMSWIAIDDVIGAILQSLSTESLQGPVNAVSTIPVTNLEFTKALGHALSRPTIFPMPASAARLAFGEMADELLLSSTRVQPVKLVGSGYRFKFVELKEALAHLLK